MGLYGGIIAALCILGFGNGFLKFSVRTSLQRSVFTHEKMASLASLFLALGFIGPEFGSSASGAI